MISYKKTLFILIIISGLFVKNSISQDIEPNLSHLLEKVNHFDEHLQPDSIISIAEGLIQRSVEFQENMDFQAIINHAIHASITIQNPKLTNKYISIITAIKSYTQDKSRFGNFNLGIANMLTYMHQYNESIHYCNIAYENFISGDDLEGQTRVLLAMYDNAYFSQADSTNMSYLNQAVEKAGESKDSSLLSDVYFQAGIAYYRRNDHVKAIANYKKAKEYCSKTKAAHYLGICLYQHLDYTITDSVEQACNLSNFILQASLAPNMEVYLSNAYLSKAYCTAKHQLVDSTKFYLDLSEEWRSKTPKVRASPGYYDQMYRVSMIIKDYDRALRYLETKADQENEINRRNKEYEFGDSRAKFDYLLQKARIGELLAQNDVVSEKARRRKLTVMGIGAVLLISLVFFLNSRKQYKSLSYSYKSLVKKHVEIDKLNTQHINGNGKIVNKRSAVHIKDEDKILQELQKLLNEDKIYKNSDLSLSSLAEQLGTNTTYLSTIVNTHFQINLKTLVNKYRIDEARKLLVSEETASYSIEGIANEVGFQSRSVFYQTFKQITGMTPTSYVKNYKSVCPDS